MLDPENELHRGLVMATMGALPAYGITKWYEKDDKEDQESNAARNATIAGLLSGFTGYFSSDIADAYDAVRRSLDDNS
jgi:hypothetical protein